MSQAAGSSSDRNATSQLSDRKAASSQLWCSCLVILLFAALVVIAQIAVAHDDLLIPSRVARWKHSTDMYADQRFFGSETDQLLFGVIPTADYSSGGVYFTGASLTKRALMIWDWPAEDRKHVHNYCVPASTHLEQSQFIHYLIDHTALLKAGGQHTVIITELCFSSACQSRSTEFQDVDAIWRTWFSRPGLLQYDLRTGIKPIPESTVLRGLKVAWLRSNVFWNWTLQFVHLAVPSQPIVAGKKVDPMEARDYWSRRLGPDWISGMDAQLRDFADLIDYLHSKNVTVAAVYMPQADWTHGYQQAERYREKALPMLASKSVEVLDLSHAVDDTGFADTTHLNYAGSQKIQPALIQFAEKYVRRIDAGQAR